MAGPHDADEELLAELHAAMVSAAAVPDWFLDTANAAFAWHRLNVELAVLTADSAAEPEPAGARAEPLAVRSLTFSGRAVTIELEIEPGAVHGQVLPPQAGTVELRGRRGTPAPVAVDDDGWFAIRPRPTGVFRLVFRSAAGHSVLTDWAIA
ncbi:hypothetical protein ACWED2_14070 [Amycolatopsis sp. NPDC005003]